MFSLQKSFIVASAVAPVGTCLAYCQKQSVPILEGVVRCISIIASPIDMLIQTAVIPIWLIYDDLRSIASIGDLVVTPLRLPAKVLLGTLLGLFTQLIECRYRIKDIFNCDSQELYHQYSGKWHWLTSSQPPVNSQEDSEPLTVKRNDITIHCGSAGEIPLINDLLNRDESPVLSKLEEKKCTHWYIYRQPPLTPPMLNNGTSRFLLYSHATGPVINTHIDILGFQPNANDANDIGTAERRETIYSAREYLNLNRYNLLPYRVMQTLENWPEFNGNLN